LDHEAVIRSQEKELEQLRGSQRKGKPCWLSCQRLGGLEKCLKMQKRDSELQQKEFVVQTARQELKEMCQRAEEAEAILGSEKVAFNEAKVCLEDDLNRALAAQESG